MMKAFVTTLALLGAAVSSPTGVPTLAAASETLPEHPTFTRDVLPILNSPVRPVTGQTCSHRCHC